MTPRVDREFGGGDGVRLGIAGFDNISCSFLGPGSDGYGPTIRIWQMVVLSRGMSGAVLVALSWLYISVRFCSTDV